MKLTFAIFSILISSFSIAQTTEIQYLSGTGADQTVSWEFYCSNGMNSKQWSIIEVPSCWEQQGFGAYNYGHDKFEDRLNETGQYRYQFEVPKEWKNKEVNIVFEGVMTDAEVKINGKLAGPVHQGAFYNFKYDISKLLKFDRKNLLEVLVKKHSDNESINQAERKADFWIFGGIFRPVFLEAKPKENIQRLAIDAKADGQISADVFISGFKNANTIKVSVESLSGEKAGSFTANITTEKNLISGKINQPLTWTPEFPNLYNAIFTLFDKQGNRLHAVTQRIGFRTVDVRESDGIYVNGERIKMKGVDRHTFHPKYGRTSSKAISIEVVNLMKDMNMNAVRMSHYPPDGHFLDVCDSLGLFVLDELCAWQRPSYDDVVGRKLLEEMIANDVNHPSVILWANGNEGGENNNLNDDFYELDIQKRQVIHPWQDYDKTNTLHYFNYNYLSNDGFSKRKIYFPTEILHGLYDGGHGAGLEDYWLRMWNDPLNAGAFLWVFADEAVMRTDRNSELDTDGNHAPDGILGPFHEKEGSFFTIKEIWAPIHFEKRYITPEFDGTFRIENRYHFTNLNQCNFRAEWIRFLDLENKSEIMKNKEEFSIDLRPGQKGKIKLKLPKNWMDEDVLRIIATDPHGKEIYKWSWPVKTPEQKASELITEISKTNPIVQEKENKYFVQAGDMSFEFSKKDGTIQQIKNKDRLIPFSNGPVFVSKEKQVKNVSHFTDGNNIIIEAIFEKNDTVKWIVKGSGLLDLKVAYEPAGSCNFAGISFDFPEENIAGMKWMGRGPYRVWKNRMKGTEFGVWEKEYNNTITGHSGFIYPEFKGYHAETYWAKIQGKDFPDFKVYVHSKDVFLRMLTPEHPEEPRNTKIEFPLGDISFLHGINAIGSKFKKAEKFGSNPAHTTLIPEKYTAENCI